MRFVTARKGLAAAAIAATLASAGLAAAIPASAATGARVTVATRAIGTGTVVVTCAGVPTVRPTRYVIACADANNYLAGLSWRVWGWHKTAYGHGLQRINTCRPTCSAGHFGTFTVAVVLWGAKPYARGLLSYRWLTLIYTRQRPRHTGTTVTYRLPG
jgi:hypothetical protein